MMATASIPGLVSVVIPAYNAGWCVGRALDSVLAQSHTRIEVLVIDDGSTDDTASVARSYGDPVRLLQQPNGGLSSARNLGIRHARGEWIAYLDADDWWLPEKLARQIELLRRQPDVGFCSSATRVEDPEGRLIGSWSCPKIARSPLQSIFLTNAAVAGSGSAVLVRSEIQRRAGYFDESLPSLEDIDMWMRLASIAGYTCLDEQLAVILKRPDSMSRNLDKMRSSAIRVMRKNRGLLPGPLQGAFWRFAYAGMMADYAKWEFRSGRPLQASAHILAALAHSPLRRGRLLLGILAAGLAGGLGAPHSGINDHARPDQR
jgi:glycosyltransferase involved in cell wall biosynthesis